MIIYRPIRSNLCTQGFGENKVCAKIYSDGEAVRPFAIVVSNGITCPVGSAKFYPLMNLEGHDGEDWIARYGENLYFPVDASEAGGWHSVEASDVEGGLGVDVVSNKPFYKGNYLKFRFWHLVEGYKDIDVTFGELIGKCDSTGASGGNHLHWAMKQCDKDGNSIYPNNGYCGAETFRIFFNNTFVLDVIGIFEETKTFIEFAVIVLENIKQFLLNYKKNHG